MEPLLTQITGCWHKIPNVKRIINLTIWSHGCDWFHCQRETSDPTVSPDDDSHMVSTLQGKDRKTNPLQPTSQHPSQNYMGENGLVQETPTHCFASLISCRVNSSARYTCATVFVLLHPGWPWCSDVLTDCCKTPSRQFRRFVIKQSLGPTYVEPNIRPKANKSAGSKIKQMWRKSAAKALSGNTERSSRVWLRVSGLADKKQVLNKCNLLRKWSFQRSVTKLNKAVFLYKIL